MKVCCNSPNLSPMSSSHEYSSLLLVKIAGSFIQARDLPASNLVFYKWKVCDLFLLVGMDPSNFIQIGKGISYRGLRIPSKKTC